MTRHRISWLAAGLVVAGMAGGAPPALPHGDEPAAQEAAGDHHMGGHMGGGAMPGTLDEMRELHRQHEHEHDFATIERMSPEERAELMALMQEIGVALPPMDPARGRELFVQEGCVVCHSVNGVGGDLGPPLNSEAMPRPMNAFEFAARMWRGAAAMTALQEQILGDVISLSGQDLADLVAFAHDEHEQAKLDARDIPAEYRKLIAGD